MPRYRETAEYLAEQRIKHRIMRNALARKDPENYKRGSDGRVTRIVETVGICARCTHEFTYRMTTKPRKYCPECYVIRQRELKRASETRGRRVAAPLPSSRLIPYVGYDPTETPLTGGHDDEYEASHSWA